MAPPAYSPTAHVLRFGRPPEDAPDPLAPCLAKARLTQFFLPDSPPASPEAFRQLTRHCALVLLDLDLGAPALAWLSALRQQRPGLPVIGCFARADLNELLPAGILGLHGSLHLPSRPESIAAILAPWLPAPPPELPRIDSLDRASTKFAVRAKRHPATHLSPASEANQTLLQALADQPDATRFIATGPAGSEFILLALELAARAGVDESEIHFNSASPATAPRFLVTRDRAAFASTRAVHALLISESSDKPSEQSPDSASPAVILHLKPLHRRLPDIAYYLRRHLPALALAARREAPLLPLPYPWAHALLDHLWPGEFDELWRVLQQLALTPLDSPAPLPTAPAETAPATFEHLLTIAAPRAYRARLSQRIPAGLLPAVMTALGCPDLPPGHE